MRGTIRRKLLMTLVIALTLGLFSSMTAVAEGETGWETTSGKIYYNYATDSGLIRAVGLQQIGKYYYYFAENGELQTGWVSTSDGPRYFRPTGKAGRRGRMLTGFQKIGSRYFNLDENGLPQTGLMKVGKYYYFFRTKGRPGVYGRSYMNAWATWEGAKYYFKANGRRVKNKWVGSYYVGSDGKRLVNTVTPDGYKVDANGKKVGTTKINGFVKLSGKWYYFDLSKKKFLTGTFKKVSGNKYYLNEEGIRVTGWQSINGAVYYFNKKGVMQDGQVTISGKTYYFKSGKLQRSVTVDGITTDANGVIVSSSSGSGKPKILLVAGHGQGDSGAVSGSYQEYLKTREFAALIYNELKTGGKVDVTYYKNGSTSYDMYQQNVKTLGSAGLNISSKITGSGSIKSQVVKGMATNSNLPVLTNYDYVLEVHFNATGVANKDPNGNGSYKGFSFYVNSYKKQFKVENKMISKIKALGFAIFGGGVHKSSTLFNARICQELGVDYSLVETAFIDDGDDMKFYNNNKTKMAKAVADSIVEYYVK